MLLTPLRHTYPLRLPPKFHRDVVAPDGLPIVIEWEMLEVGTSVFIPAVNLTKLLLQVQDVTKRKRMTVKGYPRIEAGKYGMRFWRVV